MAYQALYRKWRPQTFEQVLGQTATVKTLRRQIEDVKNALRARKGEHDGVELLGDLADAVGKGADILQKADEDAAGEAVVDEVELFVDPFCRVGKFEGFIVEVSLFAVVSDSEKLETHSAEGVGRRYRAVGLIITGRVGSGDFTHFQALIPNAYTYAVAGSHIAAGVYIRRAGFHLFIHIDPAISVNAGSSRHGRVRTDPR